VKKYRNNVVAKMVFPATQITMTHYFGGIAPAMMERSGLYCSYAFFLEKNEWWTHFDRADRFQTTYPLLESLIELIAPCWFTWGEHPKGRMVLFFLETN